MARRLIPLAPMETLLRKRGAERVSENAKRALQEFLEDYGARLAADAVRYAQHAGRRTIKAADVKLAKSSPS